MAFDWLHRLGAWLKKPAGQGEANPSEADRREAERLIETLKSTGVSREEALAMLWRNGEPIWQSCALREAEKALREASASRAFIPQFAAFMRHDPEFANQSFARCGGIVVPDSLSLFALGTLRSLPEQMTIQGDLSIRSCPMLTAIGRIRVEGDLSLASCRNLEVIASGTVVKGNLEVVKCDKLILPLKGVRVKGRIDSQ